MSEYYKAETIAARHLVISTGGGTSSDVTLIAPLEGTLIDIDYLEGTLIEV